MTPTLEDLARQRIAAKQAEQAAVQHRRLLDEQLATLLRDPAKPEGSVTAKAGGLALTATYSVNRTIDAELLRERWSALPLNVQDSFAEFVVSRPGSTTIDIREAA